MNEFVRSAGLLLPFGAAFVGLFWLFGRRGTDPTARVLAALLAAALGAVLHLLLQGPGR